MSGIIFSLVFILQVVSRFLPQTRGENKDIGGSSTNIITFREGS